MACKAQPPSDPPRPGLLFPLGLTAIPLPSSPSLSYHSSFRSRSSPQFPTPPSSLTEQSLVPWKCPLVDPPYLCKATRRGLPFQTLEALPETQTPPT
ncbi:hypothetical protein PGT21_034419 [Puccinia graminis f. sp. tritici]|uniref:Uncharacterized protein n=1 Tax=Puccinia graminis f. sp. tritici TaxID=56615 RepID=A0A5B0QQY3_PUCGR|nr:hypothetical protein PGT21_034419 [Puccinia graminis f. sp. tritici]